MDYKIKITTALVIAYALFIIYVVIKRLWNWYKNDYGYKYYLVGRVFVNSVENRTDIDNCVMKIKAKNYNEAMGIFTDQTTSYKHNGKGDVFCFVWDEMTYWQSNK